MRSPETLSQCIGASVIQMPVLPLLLLSLSFRFPFLAEFLMQDREEEARASVSRDQRLETGSLASVSSEARSTSLADADADARSTGETALEQRALHVCHCML